MYKTQQQSFIDRLDQLLNMVCIRGEIRATKA